MLPKSHGGSIFKEISRRQFLKQSGATVLLASTLPLPLQACTHQALERLKTNVPADVLIAELKKSIPELMNKNKVPGLSIAIIRDAKILWSQGFGVKSTLTKEPVSIDTVFEAASLSKPAFAYAVLKLWEQGKLGLDTSLNPRATAEEETPGV